LGEWVGRRVEERRIVAALGIAVGEEHRNLVEVKQLHNLAEERELRIVAAGAGRTGAVAEEHHMEAVDRTAEEEVHHMEVARHKEAAEEEEHHIVVDRMVVEEILCYRQLVPLPIQLSIGHLRPGGGAPYP
jgi:predicted aconitase